MAAPTDQIRERVRERYAAAATTIAHGGAASCGTDASSCCTPTVATTDKDGREVFGGALYAPEDATEPALAASLGCGEPTAVADLHDGDTVLDLGSGAGGDVLISPAASRPPAARSAST